MELLMVKSVVDGNKLQKKGTIVEVDKDTARKYLAVGIAVELPPVVEAKEVKSEIETKEHKAPRKRATKKG
jgi:hypothetical protein